MREYHIPPCSRPTLPPLVLRVWPCTCRCSCPDITTLGLQQHVCVLPTYMHAWYLATIKLAVGTDRCIPQYMIKPFHESQRSCHVDFTKSIENRRKRSALFYTYIPGLLMFKILNPWSQDKLRLEEYLEGKYIPGTRYLVLLRHCSFIVYPSNCRVINIVICDVAPWS